jgi:hypothetical protein
MSEIDKQIQQLETQIAMLKEQKAKKPEYPIKTKFYTHGCKESNYDQAEELKLSEEATRNFAYTGLEVSFDVMVFEDGKVFATHVNGMALVKPVQI